MEQPGRVSAPVEARLLSCCREAERADVVARGLDQLRSALSESFHGHLIALAEEIRGSSRLLRDLADRSQVHIARVPIVASYLDVVLPCLRRTLKDITAYYNDKTLSREKRWYVRTHPIPPYSCWREYPLLPNAPANRPGH